MKTTIELINLRIELTEITLKDVKGIVSDYTRANVLRYVYSILKPFYSTK